MQVQAWAEVMEKRTFQVKERQQKLPGRRSQMYSWGSTTLAVGLYWPWLCSRLALAPTPVPG